MQDYMMIKNQRASSLENPLAYNSLPTEILEDYSSYLAHTGKKLFNPIQPSMPLGTSKDNYESRRQSDYY